MGAVFKNKSVKDKLAGDVELESDHGILSNHTYTIIEVLDIQGLRLCKMRNPWGHGEWNGAMSDCDIGNITEDVKKALNFAALEDGEF